MNELFQNPIDGSFAPPCAELKPLEAHYTPEQLALALNVSTDELRKWRHEGRGPQFIEITPRRVRYAASAVQAFLKLRRSETLAIDVRPECLA